MKGLEYIEPQLADYELIDCGDGEKLERFGAIVTARPEPQAIWQKSLPDDEWARLADAVFRRTNDKKSDKSGAQNSDERGQWVLKSGTPERWVMGYEKDGLKIRIRLALTGFKHVGVFPEQAANWDFIYENCRKIGGGQVKIAAPKVLNLFAYTGGATVAARAAGAEVTHVDSVKQTVSWAADNQSLSGLDGTRWIVDDALKFARREVRRGVLYDGIVLDPPAYGRGPDGEKWVLEQNIDEMLELCAKLLKPSGFFVLNLYSMGLSALLARTAVHRHFGLKSAPEVPKNASNNAAYEAPKTAPEKAMNVSENSAVFHENFGELFFSDRAGKQLPLGVYYRFVR
jgi:23S rRNA (cytosine1962-C5)-methyltransferase